MYKSDLTAFRERGITMDERLKRMKDSGNETADSDWYQSLRTDEKIGEPVREPVNDGDIENVLRLLDGFSAKEESRMKLTVDDSLRQGAVEKRYHHGRCDVGSPWARGDAFDVLEES